MNINDLPDELKALALLRQEQKPISSYKTENKHAFRLDYMFNWAENPEKHEFWSNVNEGNYDMDVIEYARGIVNIDCSPILFN